ncbi:MAG: hypothetical protein GAK28_04378 [Luteibacter sp.]|uniref:hypothetical protein n=1 Tax=Luteibacter sp. TaxID=1886636 RepID=UPI001383F959|nr:hypothetical protein [Luteibacter sp.]KAF1003915.1 MAG: hypothetical protein GAK28_04378 [Luteibacter sp.]
MPKQTKDERDLAFLREMKERLEKGRNGDPTQLDYVAQMIDDWMAELGHRS